MKIKKKLRDLTEDEYRKYVETHCDGNSCSDECIFGIVTCSYHNNHSWIKNKDLFSDKFLNQEIEIEVPDILDKREKEYLSAVIKPFRDRVISISKQKCDAGCYIRIFIENKDGINKICLPFFSKKSSMYQGMELGKEYTLGDLELQNEEKNTN